MQKHDKFNIKYITRAQRWYKNYLVALGSFLIAFAAASTFAPVHNSGAQEVEIKNDVTGYYVRISNADTISLNVDSTQTGAIATDSDTINVKTNAPTGYQLYVSASSSDIYNSTDTAHAQMHLSAVDGSLTSKSTLGQNTWGFSLDDASTMEKASAAIWAAVPDDGEILISETSTANYDTGVDTDIYYGVNATTRLAAGTYSTTIYYTAVAEGATEPLMQEFTNAQCDAMGTDETMRVMDSRNTNIYTIVKARDGNCWMADNLQIDDTTIYPEDSNINSGSFYIPKSSNWDSTATATDALVHVAENEGYEGEHYYTWAAATAGATPINDTANVTTSICPKGWRLPINGDGSTDKSWAKLMNAYSITSGSQLVDATEGSEIYNLGFHKYYGNWHYGRTVEYDQNVSSLFWDSVPSGATTAHDLYYGASGEIRLQDDAHDKRYGFTVRCVFGDSRTIQDITYMQDINTNICQNTAEGYSKTLLDKRGNYSGGTQNSGYGVLKAKDGNCWMTDNLNLYNKEISSADSDFSGDPFTIADSTSWTDSSNTKNYVHRGTTSGYTDQVYYNWCAAAAYNGSCSRDTQGDRSICPKNWTLPKNGDASMDKTYAKLMDAYSITTGAQLVEAAEGSEAYNLGFRKYYGFWNVFQATELHQGSTGYFWSSTPSSAVHAYSLSYNANGLNSQRSDLNKSYGYYVRCLAR